MPNETLARRYATAIFQLATEAGRLPAVQRDLHAFIDALAADDTVRRFFRSPVVDRGEKGKVISDAFGRLDPIALHSVLLLIRKRRESLVEEIVAQLDELERASRGAERLQVASARPLSRQELDGIVDRLSRAYRTRFDVQQIVDPSLIAGVRITMGDKRADGTIAGRLDDIARLLSTN
ncbi:MAG: ATP synthase F1 subunit delta [Candidatus Eremiobacteraeota bacterium]|nr:ATP synthase F1 subunit delta [Candidatus Eremiobacteraeota bacterium]